MEPDLISKKDLLVQTGISYGQLYRWKRKGLIPEEWFIRRSTFTGQETFFPRDKMLARVDRILGMKDEDLSLDDIADAVAPDLGEIALLAAQVAERGLASPLALDALAERHPAEEPLRLGELLAAAVHDRLLADGEVSVEEGRLVVRTLEESYAGFGGRECDLVFVRKMGVSSAMLVSSSAEVAFESATKVVARVRLQELVEELAEKVRRAGVEGTDR